MYRYFNPNPFLNDHTGDCIIRSLCMLTGDDWDTVYMHVIVEGYRMKMMPCNRRMSYMLHIKRFLPRTQ